MIGIDDELHRCPPHERSVTTVATSRHDTLVLWVGRGRKRQPRHDETSCHALARGSYELD
jgi:hypothetical protein